MSKLKDQSSTVSPFPGANIEGGSVNKGKIRTKRSPQTSPKAGRDPVQPNNRGNQGQN